MATRPTSRPSSNPNPNPNPSPSPNPNPNPNPNQAFFALAGTEFTVEPGPPWWAADQKEEWPAGLKEQFLADPESPGTYDTVYRAT